MMQKIATAIYFVTEHVNNREPLKWQLRSSALDLIGQDSHGSVTTLSFIEELLSIAHIGGVLSDMNVRLIQQACRTAREQHIGHVSLPADFFKTQNELPEEKPVAPVAEKPVETATKPNVSNKRHVVNGSDTSERRDGIVAFLREHSPATTTDIKKVVRGVSEKTIQRDLKWLIRKGLVTREGTRRWATYSLSQ